MSKQQYNIFVSSAMIAAKLDFATKIARQLSLTASNARAVALRAGESASGFKPLTEFIDKLAELTISSSNKINLLAAQLSKTTSQRARTQNAIIRFNGVYKVAEASPHLTSLDNSYKVISQNQQSLEAMFNQQTKYLLEELITLQGELRTAVILATLSRVEAAQADEQYHEALNNVADNVESAAVKIKELIHDSLKLVMALVME